MNHKLTLLATAATIAVLLLIVQLQGGDSREDSDSAEEEPQAYNGNEDQQVVLANSEGANTRHTPTSNHDPGPKLNEPEPDGESETPDELPSMDEVFANMVASLPTVDNSPYMQTPVASLRIFDNRSAALKAFHQRLWGRCIRFGIPREDFTEAVESCAHLLAEVQEFHDTLVSVGRDLAIKRVTAGDFTTFRSGDPNAPTPHADAEHLIAFELILPGSEMTRSLTVMSDESADLLEAELALMLAIETYESTLLSFLGF